MKILLIKITKEKEKNMDKIFLKIQERKYYRKKLLKTGNSFFIRKVKSNLNLNNFIHSALSHNNE